MWSSTLRSSATFCRRQQDGHGEGRSLLGRETSKAGNARSSLASCSGRRVPSAPRSGTYGGKPGSQRGSTGAPTRQRRHERATAFGCAARGGSGRSAIVAYLVVALSAQVFFSFDQHDCRNADLSVAAHTNGTATASPDTIAIAQSRARIVVDEDVLMRPRTLPAEMRTCVVTNLQY